MIDGFLGYNQIAVHEDDKEKTAFTTPWVPLCMIKCRSV